MTSSSIRAGLAAGCRVVSFVGCSGPAGQPKVDPSKQATISGSVMIDGKPLPVDSVVRFESTDTGTAATGKVDALGNFSASPQDPKIGLEAGRYRVMITPPAKGAVEVNSPDYMKAMQGGGDMRKNLNASDGSPIPKEFRSLQTSKLVLEVKPGANTFNIDLAKIQ